MNVDITPTADAVKAGVSVFAPAKLNLALHVCGRRDDGFHLLDSLVVFADAGDRVDVRPAKDFRLTLTGPFARVLARAPENLVLRAAHVLAAKTGVSAGVEIVLEKTLPIASGIGGGSSDAAATLLACAALWQVDLAQFTDDEIAATLGADVPICLRRAPAVMRGIGEKITPVAALPDAWLVLANPGRPLATKTVFGALRGRFSAALEPLPAVSTVADLAAYLKRCRNDLTAPAVELMPAIATVLDALGSSADCLLARLSGSGPTCFGLFADGRAAANAAATIAAAHPKWWIATATVRSF